jgi:hypothetical protein
MALLKTLFLLAFFLRMRTVGTIARFKRLSMLRAFIRLARAMLVGNPLTPTCANIMTHRFIIYRSIRQQRSRYRAPKMFPKKLDTAVMTLANKEEFGAALVLPLLSQPVSHQLGAPSCKPVNEIDSPFGSPLWQL